jgi:gamma-glutamylcysteine synthetase
MSCIEFDTETIYADSVTVRECKLILQVFPKGLSIMDLGYKGRKKKDFLLTYNDLTISLQKVHVYLNNGSQK